MDLIFALFVYPGLIPAVLLTLLFNILVSQRRLVLPPDIMKAVLSTDGLGAVVSIILAISALVYMPWPFNGAYSNVAGPLLMWAALEAAFLVPSLIAQTSSSPMVVRGAARSLQIGLAGRIVIWCAFGALYWANQTISWDIVPALALAWISGILALPAAIGVGMFRNDTALTGVITTGLNLSTVALMQIAADVRATVLVVMVTSSLVPLDFSNGVGRLIAIIVSTIVTMVIIRFMIRNQPFVTLAAALRWCWWRALPPAVIAIAYLQFFVS
ncbi:MAG: hypothetical protein ACO3F2_07265 [Roseiflexaceae bacterium]